MYVCIPKGMEHSVSVSCCQCEPIAVTLVRACLWPATAQNPRLAYTFELLDWAEALLYECQVALKDLWAALQYRVPHHLIKVGTKYPSVLKFKRLHCNLLFFSEEKHLSIPN